MGRKCCASKLQVRIYKGESKNGISMHKFPRGGDWKVTDQIFICSKHFSASDFVTERRNPNATRCMKKKDAELKCR